MKIVPNTASGKIGCICTLLAFVILLYAHRISTFNLLPGFIGFLLAISAFLICIYSFFKDKERAAILFASLIYGLIILTKLLILQFH